MSLSRADVGRALLIELKRGYDVVRISRWAYRLHVDAREFDSGLEPEILKIIAMEEGPEFEIPEEELWRLAKSWTE